jgi:hypothetical protein
LFLDLAESLDVFGMSDEFPFVLLVGVLGDLSLSSHVVLSGKLSFTGNLVGRTERDHLVFEDLTFFLEVDASGFDLAVEIRVLSVGGGKVGGEGV